MKLRWTRTNLGVAAVHSSDRTAWETFRDWRHELMTASRRPEDRKIERRDSDPYDAVGADLIERLGKLTGSYREGGLRHWPLCVHGG